jgi:lipopolysaccharide transport system ATP-binding protein
MEAYVNNVLNVISSKTWQIPSVAPPSPTTAESLAHLHPDQDSETARDHPATASLQEPERDVPAPGSDMARLLAVRVINRRKETTSALAIDEPVGIEVTYEILREGKNIQPALYFKTPADTYAFVAAFTDPEFMRRTTRAGRYVTIAWVPPQLLNTGVMYVSVALATPDPLERHCVADRVISFQVYERFDRLVDSARGLYAREFPGLVRPRLSWETHFSSGREPSPTTPTPLGVS